MKIWHKKVISLFAGFFIFFVIGEVGVRAYVNFFKPLYRPSNIYGLYAEPNPGADVLRDGIRYKINSAGLRDYEYRLEKPKDVYRIAVIGDSITWGYNQLEDTYPKALERKLRGNFQDKKFEVINFGIESTGSQNHLELMKKRVLLYSPDLVILGYCLNDILDDVRNAQVPSIIKWITQRSYLASFVLVKSISGLRIFRAKWGFMTHDKYYKQVLELYNDKKKVPLTGAFLREMNDLSKHDEIKFVVIIFPFKNQLEPNASVKPQKVVSTACIKEEIPFLDMRSELKKNKIDMNKIYLHGDTIHFSALSNEIIANSIVKFLLLENFITK